MLLVPRGVGSIKYRKVEMMNFWKDLSTGAVIIALFWLFGFYVSDPVISVPLLAVAVFLTIFAVVSVIPRVRLFKADLTRIDSMSGLEFELFLEQFFDLQGYRTFRTQYYGDKGADLILEDGRDKIAVQAKRSKYPVGPKAVYEVLGAKKHFACHRGVVVTNSWFKKDARQVARKYSVELIDREILRRYLDKRRKQKRIASEDGDASESDKKRAPKETILGTIDKEWKKAPVLPKSFPKRCTVCDREVSEKVRRYCYEHENIFLGKVLCFEHQQPMKKVFYEEQKGSEEKNNVNNGSAG